MPIETTQTVTSDPAELESRDMMLNIGPAHPAMHGIVRIVTKLEGEQIQEAEVEIGYLHRGFEKMAETVDYNGVIPYTDRLNYVSPLINNMGYCMAVEKLLGISVPERCHYIRVIVSEISRISDHLTCVGASAMELGAFTVFLYMIKAREYLWELVEKVTGARLTVSYCRVGGVKGDLPEDFAEPCAKAFEETRKVLKEADGLLTRNRLFADRMMGTGVISAEDAISYGITGPFLRGSGSDYDVRKDCPYAVYDRLPFDVPVGTRGDNMDRYLVPHGGDGTVHAHRGTGAGRHAARPGAGQPRNRTPHPGGGDGRRGENGKHRLHFGRQRSDLSNSRGLESHPASFHSDRRKAGLLPSQGRYVRKHRRPYAAIQVGYVRPRGSATRGRGLLPGGRG